VYLDTDFLQAIGELNDQGLAAECLCLAQIEGEFCYLEQWERQLSKREQVMHLERGDLIRRKQETNSPPNGGPQMTMKGESGIAAHP
jgi:hypothetical protein